MKFKKEDLLRHTVRDIVESIKDNEEWGANCTCCPAGR